MPSKAHLDFAEWERCDRFFMEVQSTSTNAPNGGRIMWERPGDDRFTIYTKESGPELKKNERIKMRDGDTC
jgi:hypothetical protein